VSPAFGFKGEAIPEEIIENGSGERIDNVGSGNGIRDLESLPIANGQRIAGA
jgi:hypothetical protein